MKRAAAIIGPTPSFVRWSIAYDCKFRQLDGQSPTYQAFRQLRHLREVSLARIENRVVDGFCIHGTQNQDAQSARGFSIDEVLDFFGSADDIDGTCGNCPAAAAKYRGLSSAHQQWAACYGWMPAESDSVQLIPAFNELTFSNADFGNIQTVNNTQSTWHKVWQTNQWHGLQLNSLQQLLRQVQENSDHLLHSEFIDLLDAVTACCEHGLTLDTELIPSGRSDGVTWTIGNHCDCCKSEAPPNDKRCSQCGSAGAWRPAAKRKVLGLRPYMILKDIIGMSATESLLQLYHEIQQRKG